MVCSSVNENTYMVRFTSETYCPSYTYIDSSCYKNFYSDDAIVSPDEGNEGEENGDPEEVVSDNEVDPEEPEESVSENTLSENTASENSISENESTSDNQVHHATDYEGPWEGDIIVNVDTQLEEYMPDVIDLLGIIGGCVIFLAVVTLLKYIYKFFRVFF